MAEILSAENISPSVQPGSEAGGFEGRTGGEKGNPTPSHRYTLIPAACSNPIAPQPYVVCSECGLDLT